MAIVSPKRLATLASMQPRLAPATLAYVGVGIVSVGLGATAAAQGYPASYGLTTAEALDFLDDRPVGMTILWAAYALLLVALASFRTWWLSRNGPDYRCTAVRGSLWLWGAIGGPWVDVAAAWQIQLQDRLGTETETHGSVLGQAVGYWWLGALVCLVVAPVWSTTLAVRRSTAGRRGLPLDEKVLARSARSGA
jgi:hypothetical protein